MYNKFTVAIAVYRNDNPEHFYEAVHSIYTIQTLKPSEIIIVIDGPIPDNIENVLSKLSLEIPIIRQIRFNENRGHAEARQAALNASSNEFVALMDADDISLPDRFEKQIAFINSHTDVIIVGGQISEFVGTPSSVVGKRIVPCINEEIYTCIKKRCPFNQVSVMLLRSPILKTGGYIDWYCEEDYYLWIRMAQAGYKFANLPDTLVNVRVGKDMYARRGGWKYFKSEARLQGYMHKNNIINTSRYLFNVLGRFVIQVAMPNSIRGWVFQKMFRKHK